MDPRALSGLQADKRATLPLTPLPLTPLLPRPLSFSVPSAQAFSQAQWARQQLEDKLNLESPRDATTPRGMRPYAASGWGLKLLVYEALSATLSRLLMPPPREVKVLRVYEALSYYCMRH